MNMSFFVASDGDLVYSALYIEGFSFARCMIHHVDVEQLPSKNQNPPFCFYEFSNLFMSKYIEWATGKCLDLNL